MLRCHYTHFIFNRCISYGVNSHLIWSDPSICSAGHLTDVPAAEANERSLKREGVCAAPRRCPRLWRRWPPCSCRTLSSVPLSTRAGDCALYCIPTLVVRTLVRTLWEQWTFSYDVRCRFLLRFESEANYVSCNARGFLPDNAAASQPAFQRRQSINEAYAISWRFES